MKYLNLNQWEKTRVLHFYYSNYRLKDRVNTSQPGLIITIIKCKPVNTLRGCTESVRINCLPASLQLWKGFSKLIW